MFKHEVIVENAPRFLYWIEKRGGVAIWMPIDFASSSVSTPAMTDGHKTDKPGWHWANEPEMVIVDPAEIRVLYPKEVKRCHVAIRRGAQGLRIKLTDGSDRKVKRLREKYGNDCWFEFDYDTQEAVFFLPDPDHNISLKEWAEQGGKAEQEREEAHGLHQSCEQM
jgi:hypothetical protein